MKSSNNKLICVRIDDKYDVMEKFYDGGEEEG